MLYFIYLLFKGKEDQCLIIGAGVTLAEALKASDQLLQNNIKTRVLDPFTIKPIDRQSILTNARVSLSIALCVHFVNFFYALGMWWTHCDS